MNYEIRFWREVWNSFLHILVGAVLAHTFLAYLPLWAILIILFVLGAGREYWQHRRGKLQPWWIHLNDVLTLMLGGLVWYLIVTHFGINVDILMIPMIPWAEVKLPFIITTFR